MTEAPRPQSVFTTEDWVSVWLGFAFIGVALLNPGWSLPSFGWAADSTEQAFAPASLISALVVGVAFLLLSSIGIRMMGGAIGRYVAAFPAIFGLGWLAQFLAGNATAKYWGVSYVVTALLLGLFASNVLRVPTWLQHGVRTEYYIKAGLVILGSNILFGEILSAGMIGIVQALLVILVIWYACFWIAKKFRLDDEFAVILSTAVSICGVSAAIAACGAIQGDRKKLSYVTSLVLIVAAPMMLIMPWAIRYFEIPEVVGGAWVGGTIDTSGAVVAAGELVGESAMNAAVIVKFSQNAMLGLAAFALSLWWTFRRGAETGEKPSVRVIWDRFPKFVLGFMLASLLFSFVVNEGLVSETKSLMKGLRTWWFALAFVCIGLETRFRDLVSMDEGRPAAAFLIAQTINVFWTLAIAWLLFGGVLFSAPEL